MGEPPREGSIEFTDDRRTIVMPIRGALPVLGKVRDQADLHPSVALLAGAALMGLQLVASGRFAPDPEGRHWQVAGLDAADERRITDLARSRASDGFDAATAEGMVRGLLDAVVDTMPRTTPGRVAPPERRPRPAGRRPARRRPTTSATSSSSASPGSARAVATTARTWCPSRSGSRPTRRSSSPAPYAWSSRCTRSTTPPTWPTPPSSGPRPVPRRRTASASARAPTRRSRCGPPPTRGPCSSGCSTCGSPTRSCSTPTRSCRCSTAGRPP